MLRLVTPGSGVTLDDTRLNPSRDSLTRLVETICVALITAL